MTVNTPSKDGGPSLRDRLEEIPRKGSLTRWYLDGTILFAWRARLQPSDGGSGGRVGGEKYGF